MLGLGIVREYRQSLRSYVYDDTVRTVTQLMACSAKKDNIPLNGVIAEPKRGKRITVGLIHRLSTNII